MDDEKYNEYLKNLFDCEEIKKFNLPERDSYPYFYIETIEDYEYTNSIAYEMLRRNKEFKELKEKTYTYRTKDWTTKILKLGLDPRMNFFTDEPIGILDYEYKKNRFFYESWDSHTIDDIHNGLEKLITYFFNKNEIFTLTDKNDQLNMNNYKKIQDVEFNDILIEHFNFYIPCLLTDDFIKIDTSNMKRMQQISKDIPLRILDKDFLETLNFNDTKYKYTQILPFYSRPTLSFPQSNIVNIPINLNLEDDEIKAYILKAKEEFKNQNLTIKHPLELIGNEFEEAEKPKSEKEFPTERNKRKVAIADAFYVYDLFKILEPYFEQKRKKFRDIRDEKIQLIKFEYKNIKNANDKEDSITNLKESYKDTIKQYSSDNLQFIIHLITNHSQHKVERYLNYMKEYIDNKRYAELISGKTTSQKNS